jgi:hypothetical protein
MAWDEALLNVGSVQRAAASANPTPVARDLLESTFTVTNGAHKPAAGETWWFKLIRIAASSDEMVVDAELLQVAIGYSVES